MKVYEVSPQEQMALNMTNWTSVKEIQKFLKDKGYKRLGKGAFSEAWAKPGDDTVIKLSTAEDVCWLRFAQWVQKQKNNPHLPKIYSIRTYDTGEGKLFVSRIEKLKEIDDYYNKIDKIVGNIDDIKKVAEMLWIRMLDYDGSGTGPASRGPIIAAMKKSPLNNHKLLKGLNPAQMIYRILKLYSESPLAKTVQSAHKEILKDPRCYKDLHSGNIMQRDDGTIVIMDPAAMYMTSMGSY